MWSQIPSEREPAQTIAKHRVAPHVLLADDDNLCRAAYEAALTKAGYRVTAVKDGQEALICCTTETFDVIVCDVFMPEVDGFEVLRHLIRRSLPTPVLMMSSGGTANFVDLLRSAVLLGARCGLVKPFAPERLVGTIDRIVNPAAQVHAAA